MSKTVTPIFEAIIHSIRGQKIILDYDLAKLYGVETRIVNRAVKRNIERFPSDGMFQLNEIEWESLRSQIGILDVSRGQYTKYLPFAFTELGSELTDLKNNTNQLFRIVFERLDQLDDSGPVRSPDRRKIGIKI